MLCKNNMRFLAFGLRLRLANAKDTLCPMIVYDFFSDGNHGSVTSWPVQQYGVKLSSS